MKSYTEAEMISLLRQETDARSQTQVAEEVGFTKQFINDVLNGRRDFSVNLAKAMGFEKLPDRFIRVNGKGRQA